MWLEKNPQARYEKYWKPEEHNKPIKAPQFQRIVDMGNDPEHPIYVEDNGYFIEKEIVTDHGIFIMRYTWEELPDYEKQELQEKWLIEKPWDQLKDPGKTTTESSED